VGDAQHRLLVRGACDPAAGAREAGLTAESGRPHPVPLDGFVVPALLIAIARELFLHDPMRVLAWRLLHGEVTAPAWLSFLLPAPSGAIDRDPIASLLASLALLLAVAYAALASRLSVRARAALLGLGATVIVLVPTGALVAMGLSTGRPYGQDGGVVQLPLAMDRLLAGETPYGADYSDSMLGKQARVSAFWRDYGGNPILRHHAYLPGTHLLMAPAYLVCRAVLGAFDARFVTLLAYLATAFLAYRFVRRGAVGLTAAAVVLVNPLVWWHQVFGANDLLVAGIVLAAAWAADRERPVLAGALLGLACATKQLAWPYAPFLVVHLMGARSFGDLVRRDSWMRAARPLAAAAAVFVVIVLPVLLLDPAAMYGDIVAYNVGLSGGDAYPLGGTPGFGAANFAIYFGAVASLKDHVSFLPFYALLVPLGLLLLRRQMRDGRAATALVCGSVALVASLYFSRVVHPNYLVFAAVLLPIGCLALRRDAALAVVPLSLLALAVEYAQHELLRTTWEQAVAYGASGLLGAFGPRSGALSPDPLGLAVSAAIAGVAVVVLAVFALVERSKVRLALVAAALVVGIVLPTALVVSVGSATAGEGAPRRGQDVWLAEVVEADAPSIHDGMPPVRAKEAWSTSFRLDPPSPLVALPAVRGELAEGLLQRLGLVDPRWLSVVAVLALGVVIVRRSRAPGLALAVAVGAPAGAVGLAFASPALLALGGMLATLALARSGRPFVSGLAAGATSAVTPFAIFAAPLTLAPAAAATRPATLWRGLGGVVVGLVTMLVVAVRGERILYFLWDGWRESEGTGVGLGPLSAYRGWEASTVVLVAAWLLPLAVLVAATARWRSQPSAHAVGAAVLAGLWCTLGASPHALAVPLALFALGAVQRAGEPG
jgi:Glycosyltransferase family 87